MTQSILRDPAKPDQRVDRSHAAATQLAIDEAMLLMADAGNFPEDSEFVRVWEFQSPTIVLGRSSRADLETDRKFCDQSMIPIYRRASGGATVMGGPGCLMYSVILNTQARPALKKIDEAHHFVMARVLQAVQRQLPNSCRQGTCDLTIDGRKFSGNSLRIARHHLLYHGTMLYDFDLDLIQRCLAFAPRQPDYRQQRSHRDFIANANVSPDQLARDLQGVFAANSPCATDRFLAWANDLAAEKHSLDAWRYRH